MYPIIIDDIAVEITRKRVKYLRIAINSSLGNVRVSAPMRMKDELIQHFLMSKMPWIKKHLAACVPVPQSCLSDKFCRQHLQKILPDLISKWQKIIGVDLAEYRIKKMKTRWGTCNTRARRIWINLELAKKSLNCLEYIVVHELVHLLERSHNARFKGFMDMFLPPWREYKAELKKGLH